MLGLSVSQWGLLMCCCTMRGRGPKNLIRLFMLVCEMDFSLDELETSQVSERAPGERETSSVFDVSRYRLILKLFELHVCFMLLGGKCRTSGS